MSNNPLSAVTKLIPVRASSGEIDISIDDVVANSTAICMIGYTGIALSITDAEGASGITVYGSNTLSAGYQPIYKDPLTGSDPLELIIGNNCRLSVPAHLIFGFDYIKFVRATGDTITATVNLRS